VAYIGSPLIPQVELRGWKVQPPYGDWLVETTRTANMCYYDVIIVPLGVRLTCCPLWCATVTVQVSFVALPLSGRSPAVPK